MKVHCYLMHYVDRDAFIYKFGEWLYETMLYSLQSNEGNQTANNNPNFLPHPLPKFACLI